MANFNRVMLMGNLTRDIEIRHTQGGLAIGKFGLAINRKFKVQDEQREETCFVDCTAFGKTGEILQKFVSKGSPLFIEGRLQFSTWETQDGQKRNKLEVVVENFQFMGKAGAATAGGGSDSRSAQSSSNDSYGDIPF